MTLSTLPLSYCTNVHPARTLADVEAGIEQYAVPIRDVYQGPLGLGLWFADEVSRELAVANRVDSLIERLARHSLSCHTLNAFPFGDFHGERVKEQVYLPDWSSPDRLDYTLRCATILAKLMPPGREGSVSTLPLAFKAARVSPTFLDDCHANLIAAARALDDLHSETGRVVRLAIEPEPCCHLETTAETIAFFRELRDRADAEGCRHVVEEHLGVCYDVCHQAVEFEDAADSIASLRREEIRINKVQISCAIELENPAENEAGRTALAAYVEPRYLHQTFARTIAGSVVHEIDLTHQFCDSPTGPLRDAPAWRVHFHVPVNERRIGPLATTRPQLEVALAAVAALEYAPHLEVETYTWAVMPDGGRPPIVSGIAAELDATRALLAGLRLK